MERGSVSGRQPEFRRGAVGPRKEPAVMEDRGSVIQAHVDADGANV